jgi:hypothetical protein
MSESFLRLPALPLRSRAVPWKEVGCCFALTATSVCSFITALKARPKPPGSSIARRSRYQNMSGAQSAVGSMRSVLRLGVWVKGNRRSFSARSLGKPGEQNWGRPRWFVRSVAGSTVIEGRLAGFSGRAYSGFGELAKCMCLPWVEEKCGSGTLP